MAAAGVVLIVLADVLIPAGLSIWLIAGNARHHRSGKSERHFWIAATCALVPLGALVILAILGVPEYDARWVIPAGFLSVPGGLAPIIATVAVSGLFFDDRSWAEVGYFTVMPVFLAGLVLWQMVVITGIRRLSQRDRLARAARVAAHHAGRS